MLVNAIAGSRGVFGVGKPGAFSRASTARCPSGIGGRGASDASASAAVARATASLTEVPRDAGVLAVPAGAGALVERRWRSGAPFTGQPSKTLPRLVQAALGQTTVRTQHTYMTPVTNGGDAAGPHRRRVPG